MSPALSNSFRRPWTLFCCVASQVDGALDVTPVNTAVLAGQSAVLRCHSDRSSPLNPVSWFRRVNDGASEHIAVSCTPYSEFTSVYNFTSATAGQCDLVISSVDTSLTGVYTCQEAGSLTPPSASAYVTIIGEC